MSAPAFFDALRAARTRWLDGDPDAWARYSASCLRLEAELRSAQPTRSSPCSCPPASCRPSDAASQTEESAE